VGLLSKLSAVSLGVGVTIFLTIHARRWLRRPEPYYAAVLGPQAVIVGDDYKVAALLVYHTGATIPATVLPAPHKASIWPRPATLRGADAVTVLDARWTSTQVLQRFFSRVEEVAPLTVRYRGRPLRTFRIFRLYGLRVEDER
jgi:hypothetical protein